MFGHGKRIAVAATTLILALTGCGGGSIADGPMRDAGEVKDCFRQYGTISTEPEYWSDGAASSFKVRHSDGGADVLEVAVESNASDARDRRERLEGFAGVWDGEVRGTGNVIVALSKGSGFEAAVKECAE